MQILEELWKNDLRLEKPFIHNRQYAEALSRSDDCEKALEATLTGNSRNFFRPI